MYIQDAAVILKDLVSGLFALHKNDILHLDIKPEVCVVCMCVLVCSYH